jgi:Holliday junction resolvase
MPNANYIKGVRKERAIVNDARDKGLISFRSAGSHSCIDVITIDTINHIINLIQCKPSSMSESAKSKLLNSLKHINGTYEIVVMIE